MTKMGLEHDATIEMPNKCICGSDWKENYLLSVYDFTLAGGQPIVLYNAPWPPKKCLIVK